ncbi:hypothetical protein C4J81_00370 [Deltaproteobacteria bacterium Smac51]|nr:hypothetical protein C4J81_00290 [Deltaproteobacteria bacterium Smac51]UQZ87752.1 hypothetical protein C4J81_00370 [Deltaproteobacteria bacterium Smac51]
MIYLYTGVPGSGKSYKMVYDLSVFLEKNPDVSVISNIRELRLGHTDFEEFLDELFSGQKRPQQVENFFDYEHQQKLNEKFGGPIMYVLDECQLYFPRRMGLPKTEAYLQRHRHLGHFIYLASQSSKLVNSNFIPLIETEYHAARRTISFMGEIHYKEKSPQSNQIIRNITLRPKQKIFDLYKSFETAEIKKPKPVLFKFFLVPLLFTPFLYLFYANYLRVPEKSESAQVESSSARPVEVDRLTHERDKLRAEVSRLNERISLMSNDNEKMRETLEQKVRVFLPVVQVGNKKLTVDPETGAIVDTKQIKGHKVVCMKDIHCYYDKPLYGGVQLLSERQGGMVAPSPYVGAQTAVRPSAGAVAGVGAFIDASIVPEVEEPVRKVN